MRVHLESLELVRHLRRLLDTVQKQDPDLAKQIRRASQPPAASISLDDPAELAGRYREDLGSSIGFDATHLWVTNHDEGTIAKVDPVSGEVVMTVVVGAGPTELVAVEGSVWATVTDDGSVVQVDANSGAIVSRTPLGGASAGGGPTGISYGNGAIWVAMHREQSVVRIEL